MILSNMVYVPPFVITPIILNLVSDIQRCFGEISGIKLDYVPIKLRKENNIKTIQASLAIEGNTLNIHQITTLLEGKRVIAPEKDIKEVKNALIVYDNIGQYNPLQKSHLLKVHRDLMNDLVASPGQWRTGSVGIFKGHHISHLPPPAHQVDFLMNQLFQFLKEEKNFPWLIKACVFHYEFEFIHPFEDGNGRMGRLWQQLLLMKENKLFEFIPVEEMVKANQQSYYDALSQADKAGNSTPFLEFSLLQIKWALETYKSMAEPQPNDSLSRLAYAQNFLLDKRFSRGEYQAIHPHISSATASRDLKIGVDEGILKKTGDKNLTTYNFS